MKSIADRLIAGTNGNRGQNYMSKCTYFAQIIFIALHA